MGSVGYESLGWSLEWETRAVSAVLRISLRVIAPQRCQIGGTNRGYERSGAESFIYGLKGSLDCHVRYQRCIIHVVFAPTDNVYGVC